MVSSSEIALLYRIAQLAERYGMRPSDADARLTLNLEGENDAKFDHFKLSFPSMAMPEVVESHDRMLAALGCNSQGALIATDFSELEDAVEKALTLAPRARLR